MSESGVSSEGTSPPPEETPVEEETSFEELDEVEPEAQKESLGTEFVRDKLMQSQDREEFEPEPEPQPKSEPKSESKPEKTDDKSKAKDTLKNLFNRNKQSQQKKQESKSGGGGFKGPNIRDVINRIKEFRGNARQEQADNWEAAKRNLEDAVASGDKPLIEAALKNLFDAAPEELELGKVYPSKSALQKRQGVDSLIGRALCILCDGSKTRRADFLKHLHTEKGYMWGYEEFLQNHPELDRISSRGGLPTTKQTNYDRYEAEDDSPSSLVLNLKVYLKNNRFKPVIESEESSDEDYST